MFRTSETAYAVDRDGLIVAWNQAAEKTFGYTEFEALGKSCWELLGGRDVFGNQLCCSGCPIRTTAFNDEKINRFQIFFDTASQQSTRFTVSTLMLLNDAGNEAFVHLCQPETNSTADPERCSGKPDASNPRRALTARETEVLGLLHKGMTVAEIATVLSISPSTVRNHTQHIFSKLRVNSRFEAVALARKLSLI